VVVVPAAWLDDVVLATVWPCVLEGSVVVDPDDDVEATPSAAVAVSPAVPPRPKIAYKAKATTTTAVAISLFMSAPPRDFTALYRQGYKRDISPCGAIVWGYKLQRLTLWF
jgi:hypothetical protein